MEAAADLRPEVTIVDADPGSADAASAMTSLYADLRQFVAGADLDARIAGHIQAMEAAW